MNYTEGKAKTKAITLFPQDIAAFNQIAKDFGLESFSAAVRFVLRDWMRRDVRIVDVAEESNT